MTLTNAERQARYRERTRRLAVAAEQYYGPAMADLLLRTRRQIRSWKRLLARYDAGLMRTSTNGIDCSEEMTANLRRMIVESKYLIAKHDPNALSADGNIEISAAPSDQLLLIFAGRAVSFLIDEDGEAQDVCAFTDEDVARAHAEMSGRLFGIVGEDHWSIMVEDAQMPTAPQSDARVDQTLVYALIQEMPNGWWKGLISGWHDLPEQFEPSHNRIISEMTAVAREYIRERRDREIAIRPSTPIQHHGWQLVPISVD